MRRRGRGRAAPRGPGRGSVAGLRERPPGHRGRARASTDGSLVDLHGQHAHQSLLVGPDAAGRARPLRRRRPGAAPRGPPAHPVHRRGAGRSRWRRPGPGPRDRPAALPGRRARPRPPWTTPARTSGSTPRRTPWPASRTTGRPPPSAVAALGDDGARDAVAAATAALAGRAPFAAVQDRLLALSAELDDALAELRHADEALDEDPERLAEVRVRRHLLHELRRKYGETLAEVIAYRDETELRLAELEGHDQRVAELEAERAAAERAEAAAADVVGRARRAAAPELARAVEAHLHELAMPKARVEVAVADDPEGRRGHVPARRQPGRAAAAAGQGGLRRRAGPGDAGAAPRPHRGARHPGVRRGRRRRRRRGGAGGRTRAGPPRAAPPGAGRHPPAPGGGVRPGTRSPSTSRSPTVGAWPRPARSRARPGWSSWPGCCRA